ncbi:unnamed protein product [Prunus armeniaca]|uniref:Uncharacterized protein n=1 Tax=Prunus armeniaca TaxID=36596 RepID=A0A6J5WR82_PRUAR|nr:unnamed protein product [Prunus armeniaca]
MNVTMSKQMCLEIWSVSCVQISYDYRRRDRQAMWITKFQVVRCKRGSYMKILHSTVHDACINGNWHARVDFSFMSDCEGSKPQGEE